MVIRSVPAQICANCDEEFLDEGVTTRVLQIAEEAATAGDPVESGIFAAA